MFGLFHFANYFLQKSCQHGALFSLGEKGLGGKCLVSPTPDVKYCLDCWGARVASQSDIFKMRAVPSPHIIGGNIV